VVVRVNDRGPFHPGRIIDLSYTAALKLDLLRGVGKVEVERITFEDIRTGAWRRGPGGDPAGTSGEPSVATVPPQPEATGVDVAELPRASTSPAPAAAPAAAGFWVQLGAFTQREGAEVFHRRVAADLNWLAPLLGVFGDAGLFRLQAGPYASRDEADVVGRQVREALSLVPVVVLRR
jgi:rare lipoprotein A